MGINFRVIDGDYFSYEEFVELYNDYSIRTEDIKKKVGGSRYLRFLKEALANDDIKRRPLGGSQIKNYHYDKRRKKFRVRKVIGGKYTCFGYYEKEDDAKRVVEILREIGWDKKRFEVEYGADNLERYGEE